MQPPGRDVLPLERVLERGDRRVGPDSTARAGALIAAIEIAPFANGSSRSAGLITASIAPRGSSEISRPRRAMTATASSRAITPASAAATYSPTLCPIIAAGRTPHDIHSSASAYPTENSAG